MSIIIFFTIVFIYIILDDKMVNDEKKECSKIKWTNKDAEQYYNKNFKK
jgi:hypothetical protein